MRKKLFVVGVILLVLGFAVAGVGLAKIRGSSTESSVTTHYAQNEYISSEINITTPSILTVSSSSKITGVVSADLLKEVGEANLTEYAVHPNATTADVYSYVNITGTYYVVVFSNNTPTVSYLVTPLTQAVYASLVFPGIIFGVIGVVIAILGAVLKPAKQPAP